MSTASTRFELIYIQSFFEGVSNDTLADQYNISRKLPSEVTPPERKTLTTSSLLCIRNGNGYEN